MREAGVCFCTVPLAEFKAAVVHRIRPESADGVAIAAADMAVVLKKLKLENQRASSGAALLEGVTILRDRAIPSGTHPVVIHF